MSSTHSFSQNLSDRIKHLKTVTDRLGEPLDEGSLRPVALLQLAGFHTVASCEGHPSWGCPWPWIDLEAPHRPTRWQDAEARVETPAYKAWLIASAAQAYRLHTLVQAWQRAQPWSPGDTELLLPPVALGRSRLQVYDAHTIADFEHSRHLRETATQAAPDYLTRLTARQNHFSTFFQDFENQLSTGSIPLESPPQL